MSDQKTLADALNKVLANTYSLYLQTQNFHWNVTGPHFAAYHELFQEQYEDYAEAVDLIAEGVRTLEEIAPGSFAEFTKLADIEIIPSPQPAEEMIRILLEQTLKVIDSLKEAEDIADDINNLAIEDMMVERIRAHEKHAWMLRSLLG